MTTPQSGREAFEAWYAANDNTRKSIERDATGYRLIQTEAAWQAWDAAWQAALAQQGREVGEVWKVRVFPVAVNGEDDAHRVEMKRGIQSFRVGPDYWDTREEAEAYAGQIRIALAPKQDFPARFFASGPQGCAWFDDLALASAMVEAFDKDDDWTITDTQDTPAPKQQAVTDEGMEALAIKLFDDANDIYGCGEVNTFRDAMIKAVKENAALLAALPGKTEVDRG